ncbi:DNA topoisomerase family protein [Besnoitia besnoiti]|uniref:DNA topoisomerase n=1 Tax=Besnoitia besnoiti TaxID=94643 RepID=A0A2A9MAW4_BESBE|nr:DNA topoisomerase family protein [Besnoitia besnoiti]PFH35125.1 DNA topoisomerase family protein [Besnoitia besnoiti]
MRGAHLTVLNVAEKPSVAKEASRLLAGSYQNVQSQSRFNPVHQFAFCLQSRDCTMLFTSVRGHLMSLDFSPGYQNWQTTPPEELYSAPVEKSVAQDARDVQKNLVECSKKAQWLVLWLDCDREGENIAFEVLFICMKANARLQVSRAVFSALTKADLERACRTLQAPDPNQADAVDARSEIDLRIGASFTRFLTMRYRSRVQLPSATVSYGPCQSPTLGFVVSRYLEVENFVREAYWSIRVTVEKPDDEKGLNAPPISVEFTWDRQRLFDRLSVLVLYEICLEEPMATVTDVRGTEAAKRRPIPLCTVEMHKMASRKLRMSSAQCMLVAESLYQRGIISYPRTETEVFSPTMDLLALIRAHTDSAVWGAYAQKLVAGDFQWPRDGARDDKAHPPIHPLKLMQRDSFDREEEWKLYEFVTRHFLACCSEDAFGFETRVELDIAGEGFYATGLTVLERRWLDVYPYEQWTGTRLPRFLVNEQVMPSSILMNEHYTEPPPLLTEADLIDLMDKNGIGTDATMHDHIRTIQERHYSYKNESMQFVPTDLGVALYQGFKRLAEVSGVDLSLPDLRARMEADIALVARGAKSKQEVLDSHLSAMRRVFLLLKTNAPLLDSEMRQRLGGLEERVGREGVTLVANFIECGKCRASMDLKRPATGQRRTASNYCRYAVMGNARVRSASRASGGRKRDDMRAVVAAERPVCTRYTRGCPTVLLLPPKGQLAPHSVRCAYCNFQALTVTNENTKKTYQMCPQCFKNPPAEEAARLQGDNTLRCYACRHPTCPLARRSRDG